METKEIKIKVPEGYEIDKENSTFECIKFKPIGLNPIEFNPIWSEIEKFKGCYIDAGSNIKEFKGTYIKRNENANVFIDEKHAKSALAMAQISQLMPYYGGVITTREKESAKFCITACPFNGINKIYIQLNYYKFPAFKSKEYAIRFLSRPENAQLVADYYMLEEYEVSLK